MAKPQKTPPSNAPDEQPKASSWVETIVIVIGAILIALLIQRFAVKPFKVPTPSMVPTIQEGQRLLASRIGHEFGGNPKNGQIIVFNPPAAAETDAPCGAPQGANQPCLKAAPGKMKKVYVKRVVGVPGDRLRIEHGHVIRNGRAVDEPYARTCDEPVCNLGEFTIPTGTYFMMGDNRGDSLDSRFWGPLPRKLIIGRAFATYWPPKRIGGL
jgi:signal peptidase I